MDGEEIQKEGVLSYAESPPGNPTHQTVSQSSVSLKFHTSCVRVVANSRTCARGSQFSTPHDCSNLVPWCASSTQYQFRCVQTKKRLLAADTIAVKSVLAWRKPDMLPLLRREVSGRCRRLGSPGRQIVIIQTARDSTEQHPFVRTPRVESALRQIGGRRGLP